MNLISPISRIDKIWKIQLSVVVDFFAGSEFTINSTTTIWNVLINSKAGAAVRQMIGMNLEKEIKLKSNSKIQKKIRETIEKMKIFSTNNEGMEQWCTMNASNMPLEKDIHVRVRSSIEQATIGTKMKWDGTMNDWWLWN